MSQQSSDECLCPQIPSPILKRQGPETETQETAKMCATAKIWLSHQKKKL